MAGQRSSLGAVHHRLRTAILRGELEAGATVRQSELASEFGAGRTPLREALRLLQHEGLVVSEPNRQVQIAAFSPADFEELYLMRIALETLAVRLTVPVLTVDDIATLKGHMAQMEHYGAVSEPAGFAAVHRSFHQLLVASAGERAKAEISRLFDHSARYRRRFATRRDWDERHAEHREILAAASEGDSELAARRLAEHYARTAALVFGALSPDHDLGRIRTALRGAAPGTEAALRVC